MPGDPLRAKYIAETYLDNPVLRNLFVALHGDPNSDSNVAIMAAVDGIVRRREERFGTKWPLGVQYFDSATTGAWGA